MVVKHSNSRNLEQLALKWLTHFVIRQAYMFTWWTSFRYSSYESYSSAAVSFLQARGYTFSAEEHHRLLAGTKLCCLVINA